MPGPASSRRSAEPPVRCHHLRVDLKVSEAVVLIVLLEREPLLGIVIRLRHTPLTITHSTGAARTRCSALNDPSSTKLPEAALAPTNSLRCMRSCCRRTLQSLIHALQLFAPNQLRTHRASEAPRQHSGCLVGVVQSSRPYTDRWVFRMPLPRCSCQQQAPIAVQAP